jgi:hypothetical protein
MNKLKVKIFTPQELNHSSYIQTGLFELEKEGFLKTKVVLSVKKRLGIIKFIENKIVETNQPHPKTSFYTLEDKKNKLQINFATDLYDDAKSFSKYALENCDYIFKRNFETRYISLLSEKHQQKIFPLGLTFGVHTKYKKINWQFFISMMLTNLRISTKLDRMFFIRLKNCYNEQNNHWKFINTSRDITDFEKNNANFENNILFQTRCFPYETDVDVKQMHQQRMDITLLLREKFKDIFKGGIIPSLIANKNYSAALSNIPSDPLQYLQVLKNSKIVIYTRGLANSPAWKMAEYLSQAKVIIAEKLTAELPIPIIHSKQVLFFDNNDQLVIHIENCLNNEKLCLDLSNNAKKYFDEIVHPKANMKRIINFMLNQNQ